MAHFNDSLSTWIVGLCWCFISKSMVSQFQPTHTYYLMWNFWCLLLKYAEIINDLTDFNVFRYNVSEATGGHLLDILLKTNENYIHEITFKSKHIKLLLVSKRCFRNKMAVISYLVSRNSSVTSRGFLKAD